MAPKETTSHSDFVIFKMPGTSQLHAHFIAGDVSCTENSLIGQPIRQREGMMAKVHYPKAGNNRPENNAARHGYICQPDSGWFSLDRSRWRSVGSHVYDRPDGKEPHPL